MKSNNTTIFYSSDHLQWSDDTATKDHVFIHPISCFYSSDHLQWSDDTATND